MLGATVKRAEAAVGDADVGVVDVAVDDVRDDPLGMQALAHGVGGRAEFEERGVFVPVDVGIGVHESLTTRASEQCTVVRLPVTVSFKRRGGRLGGWGRLCLPTSNDDKIR